MFENADCWAFAFEGGRTSRWSTVVESSQRFCRVSVMVVQEKCDEELVAHNHSAPVTSIRFAGCAFLLEAEVSL
jgi:hypothetical protein